MYGELALEKKMGDRERVIEAFFASDGVGDEGQRYWKTSGGTAIREIRFKGKWKIAFER